MGCGGSVQSAEAEKSYDRKYAPDATSGSQSRHDSLESTTCGGECPFCKCFCPAFPPAAPADLSPLLRRAAGAWDAHTPEAKPTTEELDLLALLTYGMRGQPGKVTAPGLGTGGNAHWGNSGHPVPRTSTASLTPEEEEGPEDLPSPPAAHCMRPSTGRRHTATADAAVQTEEAWPHGSGNTRRLSACSYGSYNSMHSGSPRRPASRRSSTAASPTVVALPGPSRGVSSSLGRVRPHSPDSKAERERSPTRLSDGSDDTPPGSDRGSAKGSFARKGSAFGSPRNRPAFQRDFSVGGGLGGDGGAVRVQATRVVPASPITEPHAASGDRNDSIQSPVPCVATSEVERDVLRAVGHEARSSGASGGLDLRPSLGLDDASSAGAPCADAQSACNSPRGGPLSPGRRHRTSASARPATGDAALDCLLQQARSLTDTAFDSARHVPKVMGDALQILEADGGAFWSWEGDADVAVISELWSSEARGSGITAEPGAPPEPLRQLLVSLARDARKCQEWPACEARQRPPGSAEDSPRGAARAAAELAAAAGSFAGAALAAPVRFGDAVIAVAIVWWRRPDASGRTGPLALAYLDALAQLAGESVRNQRLLKKAVQQQRKANAMLDVAASLGSIDLSRGIGGVTLAVMESARTLVNADKCALFVAHHSRQVLMADTAGGGAIIVPMGVGLVGHVAVEGEPLNIRDVYDDPRFNRDVDKQSGYRSKSMLCVPVKNEGKIVAVAQLINKIGAPFFSAADIELFDSFAIFVGLALRNASHYTEMLRQRRMTDVVLQMVRQLADTDIRSINNVTEQVIAGARELCAADRCALFLVDEEHHELVTTIGVDADAREIRVPVGVGIVGDVARTGEPVNIGDAYSDPRFNQEVDRKTGYRTQSIMAYPIQHKGAVVAVAQLINKVDPKAGVVPFEEEDEDLLMIFAEFAGVAIGNARLYEFVLQAGNQAMDLFAQMQDADTGKHGSKGVRYATLEQVDALIELEGEISEGEVAALDTLSFPIHDYGAHNQDRLVPLIVRMWRNLGLVQRFRLENETIYRTLGTVRNMYRPVPYHNFIHAFDVTQTLYYFLTTLGLRSLLSDVDALAIMLCGVFHDIDHMGVNNSFHLKAETPLGLLSSASGSRSVLEVHHCSITIEVLQNESTNLLAPLEEGDTKTIYKMVINTILATDMARHAELLSELKAVVEASGPCDATAAQEHKSKLLTFLMKCADISNPCKPFEVARKWGIKVTEEFHSQGEQEKRSGVSTLPAVMLAGGQRAFAKGQDGFASFVVLPMYALVTSWLPALDPLRVQGELNRGRWRRVIQKDVAAQTWCMDTDLGLRYVYYFKLSHWPFEKRKMELSAAGARR